MAEKISKSDEVLNLGPTPRYVPGGRRRSMITWLDLDELPRWDEEMRVDVPTFGFSFGVTEKSLEGS